MKSIDVEKIRTENGLDGLVMFCCDEDSMAVRASGDVPVGFVAEQALALAVKELGFSKEDAAEMTEYFLDKIFKKESE